jgi:uncharacterized damage-inducible protein DinB
MDPLSEAFQHHGWATETLIRHLRKLPGAAQTATAEGVYGEVLATLSHMLNADGRYLTNLEGKDLPPRTLLDTAKPLDELADQLRDQAVRWRMLLARIGEVDVTIPETPRHPVLPHSTNLLVVQALHHGTDHRTQICTVLTLNGFEAPNLDVWTYWRDRRAE